MNRRSAQFWLSRSEPTAFSPLPVESSAAFAAPAVTLTVSITKAFRSSPPRTTPMRKGSATPGRCSTPPSLARCASSHRTGQPCTAPPPEKNCSTASPSTTPGWKARYHASKSCASTAALSIRALHGNSWTVVNLPAPRTFDRGSSTRMSSATASLVRKSHSPFARKLTRGLSSRSVKSQRCTCVAHASTAYFHFPCADSATDPTLAVPSRPNSPRTPESFPVTMRNKSASDTLAQCTCNCAGCSRAEVPATSPRTYNIPADCSTTPLRHGFASSFNCQHPGPFCSTLPETLVNANARFSLPVLKLIRPSS